MVNRRLSSGEERGSMMLDVLMGLLIITLAIVAMKNFVHSPAAGTGGSNAAVVMNEIGRIHARALTQNQSQSVVITPHGDGTTTVLTVSGHDPSAAAIESRTIAGLIVSSVQGPAATTAFMVTALPDGTLSVATAAAMQTASAPPACPPTPTISFSGLAYSIDCAGGRLVPVSSLNSFAHTARQ